MPVPLANEDPPMRDSVGGSPPGSVRSHGRALSCWPGRWFTADRGLSVAADLGVPNGGAVLEAMHIDHNGHALGVDPHDVAPPAAQAAVLDLIADRDCCAGECGGLAALDLLGPVLPPVP